MPVSIKGSGGGGVTLDAGAAVSNTTLTLPNTNGTVVIANASNNVAVTGDLNVSGATTLAGNPTVAGTVVMGSSFLRNRIINGNFNIWQRGTSFSSSGVNEYSVDRFRTEGFNLSSTISQQSFTANQTDVPYYPTYYCRVATSATVSGGQYWAFQQRIEAPQNLSGYETVTLSFYARASSGTVAANTFSYGGSSGRANNPTLTTSWQRLTHTWTGSGPASGYVEIYLMYLGAGVAATSVDLANVQLEVGTVATPFEREIYSNTLAKCQRYFQTVGGTANGFPLFRGYAESGNDLYFPQPFIVTMRATPTSTKLGTWSLTNCTGPSVTFPSADGYALTITASSTSFITAYPNSTDDKITFSAEL
jgi:hypothetical protein